MRNRVYLAVLCVCLGALAACGGGTSPYGPAPTATTPPAPTNTPATSFQTFTSPDHLFQVSYPAGWQPQEADGSNGKVSIMGPGGQVFEVNDVGIPGTDGATTVNGYCQAIQPGTAANPVQTTTVTLAGQTWTKGDCDAGTQSSTDLVVEVTTYKNVAYQIDYADTVANFQADDDAYFAPMEQSFKFLS